MKELYDGIRRRLRNDPLVRDLVGIDSDNEVKVYSEVAKMNLHAPYVVWFLSPGGISTGTYGEKYSLHIINAQFSCWADTDKLAWQLADAVHDALDRGNEYDVAPWLFMQSRLNGFPMPSPDRDSPLFQVILPMELRFSGSGSTK